MPRPRAGAAIVAALLALFVVRPLPAVDARDVLGANHAAGRYNFTDEDYLDEGADRVLAMGSRVLKVFLVPPNIESLYPFNSNWEPLPTDVVELAQRPYFQSLFGKPFSTILLVIQQAPEVDFRDGLSDAEAALERDQMLRLARYLLTAYAGSGKHFVLQNWEGDHLLRLGLDGDTPPDAVAVQGMIDWLRVRQQAVEDARAELGENGVQVDHAAEVNLLADAMAGKVTVTNDVLPAVPCDLYSYSSWDVGFAPSRLVAALDYLQAHAPESARYGRRAIYLGEYGMARETGLSDAQRYERIRQLMEAALGWGVRYALYWQVYDNVQVRGHDGRPRGRDMAGLWLVPPEGVPAQTWTDLARQAGFALHRVSLSPAAGQSLDVSLRKTVAVAHEAGDDPWQILLLKDRNGGPLVDGDTISLQAHDGSYLSVADRSGQVLASATSAGRTELFTLRRAPAGGRIGEGDAVTLQAQKSGRFLVVDATRGGVLRAGADAATATRFAYHERQ